MSDEIIKSAKNTLEKLQTNEGLIDLYLGTSCDDDYNPAVPNDYEKMILKKQRMTKEMEHTIHSHELLKAHIEATQHAHDQGLVQQLDMEMSAEEAY